jgi:hypothetical protein
VKTEKTGEIKGDIGIDYRCGDEKKNTLELGQHLGIIA